MANDKTCPAQSITTCYKYVIRGTQQNKNIEEFLDISKCLFIANNNTTRNHVFSWIIIEFLKCYVYGKEISHVVSSSLAI